MSLREAVSKFRDLFKNPVYNRLVEMSNDGLEDYYEDSRYGRSLARQAVVGINQIITYFDKFKKTESENYEGFRKSSNLEIAYSFANPEEMRKENYKFLIA
jgi:hypothetical protein